jgi:tetratricopeptide (TPR) repeat protein
MISAKTQNDLSAVLRSDDMSMASVVAEAAIARGESHEILFTLAAQMRLESGDHYGAVALYLRATELAPHNPSILAATADSMRYTGQLKESVALFDRAIECDEATVSAWYGRALALEAEGRLDDALLSYVRVTELAPTLAAGFAGLAILQTQRGDILEARKNALRAQALGPSEYGTMMACARCEIADGNHQGAVEYLRVLLSQPTMSAENEIHVRQFLGDSLDKLGLIDEAFESYKLANDRFAQLHSARNATPIALHAIDAIRSGIRKLGYSTLMPSVGTIPNEAAGHVFLLGYPRSGTTLVEQILATIPNVVSLEEAATFASAEKYLSTEGIALLAALSEDEIAALRRDYWDAVTKAGVNVSGRTFVDMDPLKGAALPLIARIFPDAKVVVMHRDPRDVVWSCYKHNFIYSPATYEFTSLPRAANHFSAMMQLIRSCIETMPLTVHILSYEELVRDFDNATRKLCTFLDLPWSPDLRNFDATARARTVRTASGSQVRRALFDGTNQWRRYAPYLTSIIPLLEPWITPSQLLDRRE